MPIRMTLTRPGETTPVYTPERVGPGRFSGFFDYTDGPNLGKFVVVSCAWHDQGGVVFDFPQSELPADRTYATGALVEIDELPPDGFKEIIPNRGSYIRDVVTPIGSELQPGRLVVEHFIEN